MGHFVSASKHSLKLLGALVHWPRTAQGRSTARNRSHCGEVTSNASVLRILRISKDPFQMKISEAELLQLLELQHWLPCWPLLHMQILQLQKTFGPMPQFSFQTKSILKPTWCFVVLPLSVGFIPLAKAASILHHKRRLAWLLVSLL